MMVTDDELLARRWSFARHLVEILDEGRGADDELAGEGAHDGSKHGSQNQSCKEWVQQNLRHAQDNGLGIGKSLTALVEESDANEAGEHGTTE